MIDNVAAMPPVIKPLVPFDLLKLLFGSKRKSERGTAINSILLAVVIYMVWDYGKTINSRIESIPDMMRRIQRIEKALQAKGIIAEDSSRDISDQPPNF